jgi:hypothetical protein
MHLHVQTTITGYAVHEFVIHHFKKIEFLEAVNKIIEPISQIFSRTYIHLTQ